jgi:hypothetical protein
LAWVSVTAIALHIVGIGLRLAGRLPLGQMRTLDGERAA